jgi:hypothetical protein
MNVLAMHERHRCTKQSYKKLTKRSIPHQSGEITHRLKETKKSFNQKTFSIKHEGELKSAVSFYKK